MLGFDRYKGGLDTVHDLTGLYSIFTRWRGIEVMFHVSTHLPNEPNDHQKVITSYMSYQTCIAQILSTSCYVNLNSFYLHSQLQRKRHIGNDIVCVVFMEADNTPFSPSCIKSHFLHTFIIVRTCTKARFKPPQYEVHINLVYYRGFHFQ